MHLESNYAGVQIARLVVRTRNAALHRMGLPIGDTGDRERIPARTRLSARWATHSETGIGDHSRQRRCVSRAQSWPQESSLPIWPGDKRHFRLALRLWSCCWPHLRSRSWPCWRAVRPTPVAPTVLCACGGGRCVDLSRLGMRGVRADGSTEVRAVLDASGGNRCRRFSSMARAAGEIGSRTT